MAPKRQSRDLPLPSSESEDEEHSTSSDDSDSNPQQLTQSKPQKPQQESEESEESDSDSDSSSDKTQKPPSAVSPDSKKPTSEPTQLKPNGKFPAETERVSKSKKIKSVEKGSKKSEMSNGDDGEIEDKKGTFLPRLFTEEDEIVLLEGMIDFKENKRGADPNLSVAEFVENLLSCSVTKSQIVNKFRRMKQKFKNNVRKGKNGKDPVISRPHDYKLFELSKKIWGSEVRGSRRKDNKDDNVGSKTSFGNKESDIDEEVMDKTEAETEDCWSLYPCLCASLESEAIKNFTAPTSPKEYVKKVVNGLETEKARELEQEWKGLVVMEQQVYAKRGKMISKQAEIVMNVIHP